MPLSIYLMDKNVFLSVISVTTNTNLRVKNNVEFIDPYFSIFQIINFACQAACS